MKRSLLILYCFLITINLTAQIPTESKDFLPKVTYPSPEAFSFTRYGDIPVGLYTGSMNYSVPLFQISSGKLSVPVSLNYATNGVKVDAVSGRTGMDWTLSIGGVITRNIMSYPDDEKILQVPPSDTSSWTFYNYLKNSADLFWNVQPDEYSYNFLGYSGKFYFDYSGNIRELSPSGNKITGGEGSFTITTPDGTIYQFFAADKTYSYSLFTQDLNPMGSSAGGITAWYLGSITNIYGDAITYSYEQITDTITYLSGVTETLRTGNNSTNWINAHYFLGVNCAKDMDFVDYPLNTAANGFNSDIRRTSLVVFKLSEINFKNGKLKLYYSSRQDLPGEQKLDSIDLISTLTNSKIRAVGLEYIYSQATGYNGTKFKFPTNLDTSLNDYSYLKKRLFLDRIKFYNSNKSKHQDYQFIYEDINGLPPKLAFSQDYFGYYNGNPAYGLIPSNQFFHNRVTPTSFTHNRSVDTLYSKKGALIKLKYPTGGYTDITYHNNTLGDWGGHEVFDTVSITYEYPISGFSISTDTFTVRDQPYELDISVEWITPPDYNGPLIDSNVVFRVYDGSNNIIWYTNNLYPGDVRKEFTWLWSLSPRLNNGPYRLYFECGNPDIRATAQLSFFKFEQDTIPAPILTGGIHVAKIKNYTDSGVITTSKYFEYSPGVSSFHFFENADYSYFERGLVGEEFKGNYVVSSTSFFGNLANDYGTVTFEKVTERFDSLGIGGAITTTFAGGINSKPFTMGCTPGNYVWDYSPMLIPGAPLSNTAFFAGKELKKEWFKRESGLDKKIRQVQNYYSLDNRLFHIDSFYTIRRAITRSSYGLYKYFNDYDINEYQRITAWVHLDSSVTKEIDSTNNELVQITAYQYGNESHLLPTLTWQISSTEDTLKNVVNYADDISLLDPNYSSTVGQMIFNNFLSYPFKTQQYRNSTLLKTAEIEYNAWFLPAKLKTSFRTGSLAVEGEYTLYDSKGNPTEFNIKGQPNVTLTDTSTGLLIVGCQNSHLSNIAFTSFESSFAGNWSGINAINIQSTGGITGEKFYNESNLSLLKTGLSSSKTYVVSYWSKNGSYSVTGTITGYPKTLKSITFGGIMWTLYEHLVTGQSTVSVTGSGAIDELRLYPKEAFITTYSHTPFVGIHSQVDQNNRITYYEYDLFGRLSIVRDENKYILKKICYNFQGEVDNCSN